MLILFSIFVLQLQVLHCHVLQFYALRFYVLQFHVLQFWRSVIFMSVIFSQPAPSYKPTRAHECSAYALYLNSSVFIIQFSLYALVDPSRLIAVGDRSFATAGPRPETVFLTTSHRLHCCQCSVVNWRRTCFDSHTQTLLLRRTSSNIKFNWSWYTGRWWVGCYIWYSEEGSVRSRSPPRPLLVVPNVTAHPLTASVSITVLLCNGSLLCGFNVPIKG